jgi:hypothetical protein
MTEPPQTQAPQGGQAFGYIHITLAGAAFGSALATAFLLLWDLPDWIGEKLHPGVVWGAKAAFAFLAWLPIVIHFLGRQVLSNTKAGGLPADIRPARTAALIAIATIPLAFLLDFVTEGRWAARRSGTGGYLVLFWACFPLLTWLAVRASRGGPRITTDEEDSAAEFAAMPRNVPYKPSRFRLADGPARRRIVSMLAVLGEVDARFVHDEVAAKAEDTTKLILELWSEPLPEEIEHTLRGNLSLSAGAYLDALRLVQASPDEAGAKLREEIPEKYRGNGSFTDELALVLDVARRARANAALELKGTP